MSTPRKARPTRAEVLGRIEEIGIVPVIRSPSADVALQAVEAIVAGGIPICEITMTVPDAPALIREVVARLGDRAVVGAGTVLDAAAAAVCLEAGAAFLVGPGLDLEVVAMVVSPGVDMASAPWATPQESAQAASLPESRP